MSYEFGVMCYEFRIMCSELIFLFTVHCSLFTANCQYPLISNNIVAIVFVLVLVKSK